MTVGLDEITIPSPTSNYNLTVDLSEMRSDIVRELNEIIATIATKATTNSPATFSTITASGVGTVTGSLNINAAGLNPLVITNNSSLYGLTKSGGANLTSTGSSWTSNVPIIAATSTNSAALATNGQVSTTLTSAKSYTDTQVATKANVSHTHTISQITSLQTTLNGKSNTDHTHSLSNLGIRRGRIGPYSIGSNASTGTLTITHGLGQTPNAAFLTVYGDNGDANIFASVIDYNSTYLNAHIGNFGDADTNVYLCWMVVE